MFVGHFGRVIAGAGGGVWKRIDEVYEMENCLVFAKEIQGTD